MCFYGQVNLLIDRVVRIASTRRGQKVRRRNGGAAFDILSVLIIIEKTGNVISAPIYISPRGFSDNAVRSLSALINL